MCGVFGKKENDFAELKTLICTYDTAIRNG